jgi:eukaryotic-like serine/threonine-protein kinase
MQCTQCGLSNPPGTGVCTRCSTPLPLDDRTIVRESDTSCDADQTLTHGWSEPSAPIRRTASAERFKPGRMLGNRYQILQLLGEGGMGAVYKAQDRELDRLVALKIIRPNLAASSEILHRFKQELILARQVTHRNVIRIFDLGEADGVKFITMEFVDGETLRTILLRGGKLTPVEASKIIQQVCRGLEAAHAEGVVHRDLKPANIMRDAQNRIVVMDFGVAHLAEAVEIRPPGPPSHESNKQAQPFFSQTGVLVGTPAYMAPEQALGQEADARSDIFAVGIIFFELLTGKLPFQADTRDVLLKRTREKAKAVHEIDPRVPRSLSRIVERCLEPLRDFRYQTATEVLTHLDAWLAPAWRKAAKWVAAAAAVLLLTGTQIVVQRFTPKTAAQHAPVSVLVADFKNDTGEGVFDGTLEPAFSTAMEGASFITSYNRGQAHKLAAQVQPGAKTLDEQLARLIATREGINTVIGGSIARQGDSYRVAVRAVDGVTGKIIATDSGKVQKKDVLVATGKLAAGIRKALGDKTPESVQLTAAETYTTQSLDAAHEYALAQVAQFAGNWNDAIRHSKIALQYDPELGRAYVVMAVMYNDLKQSQQAEKYFQLALSKLDRMSDREKYRTRGAYYLVVRKPDNAIEELQQLVSRYPADSAGIGNLALAYFYRRDMAHALEVGQREVEIYPKNVIQRNNMGLYAMYGSDFDTALREQRIVLEMNPSFALGYIGTALPQLALGHPDLAIDTYHQLEQLGPDGSSAASAGLADVALYQGRAPDAIKILQAGLTGDMASKNPDGAAAKQATLAQAHLLAGNSAEAAHAAERALALSHQSPILFWAARAYLAANQEAKARSIAHELGSGLEADPQAYGKLIAGEIQLKRGKAQEALKLFLESRKLADTWMGRFDAGRAYVEAGAFAEAGSELEVCIKRRGEATALFLDESPTYHLFPPVYYYLGRAQEGLKSPAASDSYKNFLSLKDKADHDPLVADARRRLASL